MTKVIKKLVYCLLFVPRALAVVLLVLLVTIGVLLQALAFFLIGQNRYAKKIIRRGELWIC